MLTMPEAALDQRLVELANLVADVSRPITEMGAQPLRNELKQYIDRGVSPEIEAEIFRMQAVLSARTNKQERALEEIRLALQRVPSPGESRALILGDRSSILLQLDRFEEARTSAVEALGMPGGQTLPNYLILSDALIHLERREEAFDLFRTAVDKFDLTKELNCFLLSTAACSLGLDEDAVELFARFVAKRSGLEIGDRPALDVIKDASPEIQRLLTRNQGLLQSIIRVHAKTKELERLSKLPIEDDGTPDDEARAVFDATRPLRARAIRAVLEGEGV